MNSDADAAVMGVVGGDYIRFLKQGAQKGLQDRVNLIQTEGSMPIVRAAAGDALVGTYSTVRYPLGEDISDMQQFVSAFQEETDAAPVLFACDAYDCTRWVARSVSTAESTDPDPVANSLSGLSGQTLIGTDLEFRSCDHQVAAPVWAAQNVSADDGGVPGVDILDKVGANEATPPCEDTGCTL
jgi:ABC-type branched-subunit amino acid transport system substrate-binding protein